MQTSRAEDLPPIMFLGHFAVAMGAKRVAPKTSLGTTFLAAQFADLLWPILLLFGIERVRISPGIMARSSLDFQHYPYSHSLLALTVFGVLLGLVYFAVTMYRAGAVAVAILVVSHWVLDVIVHRPDLPLSLGGQTRVGFGLWNSVVGTLLVELGFYAVGLFIYLRSTEARDRVGRYGFWALVLILLAIFLGDAFGPPPTNERALATLALAGWLFVPWAYWVDAHRQARSA